MLAAPTATFLRNRHSGRDADASGSGRDLAWLAVPAGFIVASIPFSYLMARRVSGVDLRQVGSGTVSGTGLYEVAGFGPLAAAGILEVAKGAVGPLLAGKGHPAIAVAATGAAVVGHNWSPFLRGAGGRGLSPAIGALGVAAPAAAACLLGGMAGGRLLGQTAVGSLLGAAASVPAARRAHGPVASWAAAAAVTPMLVKRLAGNSPVPKTSDYLWRLLFDRDTRAASPMARGRFGVAR
jgi:acyl phosphate:glycerol-3-phosphate acyltransferase